ncbi:hypothetical protein HPB50_007877 [Hyalomma asiaticum]|uniref:Uncharacterized protein n=1 Tax=Hyalomma asiaticum TaxID=266040 RepID=A0ACB7TED9_HYAAI|nr:hypothetical protein HPB50_007877 [Hyalomma asiaticum]
MESQQSPSDDPLILWLTGGPGCSALSAVATELGAFRIGPLGVNVTVNPYSWNNVANVLFLEAPAGVGFSYDPSGVYYSDDTKATEDNYLALLDFFEKFPQFKRNDFYAMGDSYGGIFVSLIMQRIMKEPQGINVKVNSDCICEEPHPAYMLAVRYRKPLLAVTFKRYTICSLCGSIQDLNYTSRDQKAEGAGRGFDGQVGTEASVEETDLEISWNGQNLRNSFYEQRIQTVLSLQQPISEYKMWRAGPVIAGFVQTFSKNVTFATVKVTL